MPRRVGSSPTIRTTSEQALYRLLRLFSKVRAHPFCCSSLLNRTRCAGFRFGKAWPKSSDPLIILRASNDNPNYVIQVGNVFGFIIFIENVLWKVRAEVSLRLSAIENDDIVNWYCDREVLAWLKMNYKTKWRDSIWSSDGSLNYKSY